VLICQCWCGYTEFENLLGEPLREGTAAGIPMPTVKVLYEILRAMQWRRKAEWGYGDILAGMPVKRGQDGV
jgi:hypothetical protein